MILKKIVFLILMLIMASCNYHIQKNSSENKNEGLNGNEISFAMVMTDVLGPKCLSCHAEASGNRGGVNLETYTNVIAELSAIRGAVANNSMPKNRPPLSDAEKNLLFKWIDAGARESGSEIAKPAEPSPLTLDWDTVRANVIAPSCLQCHSSPKNRGGVSLETYESTLENIAEVRTAVADESMPLRSQLTEEQKNQILAWIAIGAPRTGGL